MQDFLGHAVEVGDVVVVAMGDPGHRHALGRITGIYKTPGWRAEVDLIDPGGRIIPWVHCNQDQLLFQSAEYRTSPISYIAALYGMGKP